MRYINWQSHTHISVLIWWSISTDKSYTHLCLNLMRYINWQSHTHISVLIWWSISTDKVIDKYILKGWESNMQNNKVIYVNYRWSCDHGLKFYKIDENVLNEMMSQQSKSRKKVWQLLLQQSQWNITIEFITSHIISK